MKRIIVYKLAVLLLMGLFTGCVQPKPQRVNAEDHTEIKDSLTAESNEDYQFEEDRVLIQKGNAFSLHLFQKVATETKKSTFISTIGILYSLNVLNLGATGETLQEICDVLGVDSTDLKRMNTLCRRMIKRQEKMQADDLPGLSSNLLTGCALFVKSGVEISPLFTNDFEHFYFGHIIQGSFDDKMQSQIDDWCSNKTDNKINHLPIEDDAQSILAIVNCFNGKWEKEFDTEQTKEEIFYGRRNKTVMMMNDADDDRRLSLTQRSDYSLLRIPYRGGYVMYVILPEKGKTLLSVIQKLTLKELQNAIDDLNYYDAVYIKLPKFEMNYNWIANKWLTSMGIRKVFGRKADLDNLNKDLYVSSLSQYAKVKVDEIGTDASAVTFEVLKAKEEKEPSVAYFYADHPFAYIIQDTFGNYCFMGTFWGD